MRQHTNKRAQRTEELHEFVTRALLAEQAQNNIEEHRLGKLVRQGVIRPADNIEGVLV
jgi:hypothetical protein